MSKVAIAIAFFMVVAGLVDGCTSLPLSPAAQQEVAAYSAAIAKCQAEGKRANSYAVYEACTKDGGL